ncbi:hypothetical protein DFH09DRAFT_1326526 [Mycena vulgaris]|nr:hypothetical protein DFH09DRAFT_1326526 [Mycena vulgaris]
MSPCPIALTPVFFSFSFIIIIVAFILGYRMGRPPESLIATLWPPQCDASESASSPLPSQHLAPSHWLLHMHIHSSKSGGSHAPIAPTCAPPPPPLRTLP